MNNASLYTAGRTTHLKIVVVGLCAAILVAGVGIFTRDIDLGTEVLTQQARAPVVKAGAPINWSGTDAGTVIR